MILIDILIYFLTIFPNVHIWLQSFSNELKWHPPKNARLVEIKFCTWLPKWNVL